jgi:transcription initiation factor IIE alpha subunit
MAVSQRDVTPIIAALSPERLASYGRATADDDAAAVRLYAWNLAACCAML